MNNNTKLNIWIPAILVVLMATIYVIFNIAFVQCPGFIGCQKIDSALISQVDQPMNLSIAMTNLNEKTNKLTIENSMLTSRTAAQKDKENEIANTQGAVVKKVREISNLKIENTNVDTNMQQSNVNALNTNLYAQKVELTAITDNVNKAEQDKKIARSEVVTVRNNISLRYSSRILWVFLTAVFFAFCLAAGLFSYFVMKKILKDNFTKWFRITLWTSAFLFVAALVLDEYYMSITLSMFDQSIYQNGDIPFWAVIVSNAILFVAIVFSIAASCSIIFAVEDSNQSIEKEKTDLKNATDPVEIVKLSANLAQLESNSLEKYETLRDYSRTILYIGSAMLFVGLLRLNILSNWHLVFVSNDFVKLLTGFLKDYLSVQAGFYTILLAAIYLPVAYLIPNSPDVKKTLKDEGFLATIKEFAPRLIAVILPLLASPISDLLKYIFTGSSPQ